MVPKKNVFDFEQNLSELERIIVQMEEGNLTLEASLEQFEKGVGLIKSCQKALQAAEQRVEILVQKNSGFHLDPFIPEDPKNNG